MIFLLCDTYIKWSSQKSFLGNSSSGEDHLFYAAFESEIYWVFFIVFLGMFASSSVSFYLEIIYNDNSNILVSYL